MNVWLTASWGVLLRSFHSRRWWSSQIPQMCHSLLSPRKQSDDLEKQRHVNNAACVKHSRWYHSHNTNSTAWYPHATLTLVHFGRWKGKLHLFWYSSTSSIYEKKRWQQTVTVLVLCGEVWMAHRQTGVCTRSHLCQGGLIGSFPWGAGGMSGSEQDRSPGTQWQTWKHQAHIHTPPGSQSDQEHCHLSGCQHPTTDGYESTNKNWTKPE